MTDMGPGSLPLHVQCWARGTEGPCQPELIFPSQGEAEGALRLIGFPAAVISDSLQLICPQGGAWELLAAQQVACFPAW